MTESMLCCGCAADSVVCGDRLQHVVGLHAGGVPYRPGTRVGQQHRLLAHLAHVQRGAVRGVRHVDGQAKLVHPPHGPPAERGQAAVPDLVQAAAERVGIGVRDPDLPDAQAVEHIEAVDLVLDRGRGLQPEHQAHPARLVRGVDVGHRGDRHRVAGVSQVGLAHPQVGDDVVPPPRGVPGHAGGAVHHVVEHHGHAGRGQARVGGVLAAGAVVVRRLLHPQREPDRVVVQADHDAVVQQAPGPVLFLGGEAGAVGRHPAELWRQLDPGEVHARGEIGVGAVGRAVLGLISHGDLR
jgi:hypothetical protein